MLNELDYTYIAVFFIIGLMFGSFLNVIIYRIPKSISIIKPGSFCPHCSEKLKWYENVPVVSYIFLLGKCSHCKSKISKQYPFIELVNGVLFVVLLYFAQDITQYIFFCLLGMTFLCLIAIDFKSYLLPDSLLIVSAVIFIVYFASLEQMAVFYRFYYAFLAGSGMFVLRMITTKIYNKETFGLGDIKLSALIGFVIGGWDALIAIFFGFILAAVIFSFLIVTKIKKRDAYLPFGPYLIFGMVIYILYGDVLIHWYIHFFI